ncbi:hypothetical protein FB45DRAFT_1054120 [Roridomyces roridus]|uniref:F-box domain-containing protein n=1 Tax=Roridomyces roridus TaxID=1738132 RepID=A0AAD7FTA1_9AGAR|nr:hypothetical protein FB45DRAFT_1054120 [Roridomyces roridus]
MSNLHPTRPARAATSLLFGKPLPLAVAFEIFSLCSPFDLAQISCTSKSLRAFIQPNRCLWESAYGNLSRGNCPQLPPPPLVESRANYSPLACASWLFGGGLCTVRLLLAALKSISQFGTAMLDMDELSTVPFSLSLPRVFGQFYEDLMTSIFLRLEQAKCREELLSDNSKWVDEKNDYLAFSWGNWLPRRFRTIVGARGLVYEYSHRAIKDAEAERKQAIAVDQGDSWRDPRGTRVRSSEELDTEWALRARDRAILSQHSAFLEVWHRFYLTEKVAVEKVNMSFIKRMCRAENIKGKDVLDCPAARSVIDAFSRDLTLLTTTTWTHIRRLDDRIKCELCSRLLRPDGLFFHLQDKHEGVEVPNNSKAKQTRDRPCPDCPHSSRRLFSEQGLQDHKMSRHSGAANSFI